MLGNEFDQRLTKPAALTGGGAPPDATARALVAGTAAGAEEVYTPLSQALHVVALLRPLAGPRYLLDRLTLAMSGGRNVFRG